MSTASPWIRDTTDETFHADVLERSAQVPVVVDFWAAWCQPCRYLGPVLENLAMEFDGQFELVKADTEQTPLAAAQFRVQSIPAVYALRHGRIVDGFVGAMPEPEIRSWLQRFLPSDAQLRLEEGLAIQSSDAQAADRLFREALELDPRLDAARIALAQLCLDQKQLDQARLLLAELQKRGFLEPEAERIHAALELHDLGETVGDLSECRRRATEAPEDVDRQQELATALAAHQQYEEALEICLKIVQQHRGDRREKAKQTMVDIFRLLPADSELTTSYRRRLSLALY